MHTGQDLFVSPNGDDQNPGTKSAPVKTLVEARNRVREMIRERKEDVTIFLEAGIHRLTETLVLQPEDGSDGTFAVTWQGSGDGQACISSGYPLAGWQRCASDTEIPAAIRGKVWFVDLPSGTEVRNLYLQDLAIPRARGTAIIPEQIACDGPVPMYGPDGPLDHAARLNPGDKTLFHDRFGFAPGAIVPAADLDETEFVMIPVNQWTMNILPLGRIDFAKRVVHLKENCTYPIGIPPCARNGSIWLENSLSVMQPGTWVYHAARSRLFYCPAGDAPEMGLEAACLTEFIRVEGVFEAAVIRSPVKGIHFKNITFTRSNRFRFHGLTGKGIQHDWEMYDAPSCMVRLRHAENCSVTNCHFHHGGSGGLRMDLACRYNRVEGCEFNQLGGCGIVLCGYGLSRQFRNRENKISGNHLHHLGIHYWHSPAIFIWQSGQNHIADNHLHDLPYTGIVCSGRTLIDRDGRCECSGTIDWDAIDEQCGKGYVHNVWHYGGLPSWWMREPLMHSRENLIEYNRIRDVMQIMGDGNGIYISGAGGGNVVRFNAIGPCPSPTMAEGIRCDDDQHHTIIHGNLVFGQHGHATGITIKGVNRITNNILALPLKKPDRGMLSLETGPLNGSVIQYNIILTSQPDQRFVSEIRIHGDGRKARLCDTDSDHNIYFCAADPDAGRAWLEDKRAYGIERNSRSCDPGFIDAEHGDFRLKEGAVALVAGFQPLPLERMLRASQSDELKTQAYDDR
jgi:hypothetical protein